MDLAANLKGVRKRIEAACERAGRSPETVELMAVTKTVPVETVCAAGELGLRLFGENRVQEAALKISSCPGNLRWHMIGHLQTNKCREAVRLFSMIQGVDSLRLANEIQHHAQTLSKTIPILIEVNVAVESSKFGYKPESLLNELEAINALPRLVLHGLMAIPPWTPEPENTRPYFRRLRELKSTCEQILGAPLPVLSMGMSGDFEVAIEEGSTLIRIGTALFGPRAARSKPVKTDSDSIE